MSNTLKIYKETALPSDLQSNSIYLVAPSSNGDYLEIYVTGNDAKNVRRTINKADVETMLHANSGNANELLSVENITERNELSLDKNALVLVKDATADSTVTKGAATYFYDNTKKDWTKVSEFESMDLTLTWDSIEGKPNVSVSDLENAVKNTHSHANKTELNKIGQDSEGNLTYGGAYPRASLETSNW